DRLDGVDSFTTGTGEKIVWSGKDGYFIRFHLHPSVAAERQPGGRSAVLTFPDGETWLFETEGGELSVEESVLFSDIRGNQPTSQIALYGRPQVQPSVAWHFRRLGHDGDAH